MPDESWLKTIGDADAGGLPHGAALDVTTKAVMTASRMLILARACLKAQACSRSSGKKNEIKTRPLRTIFFLLTLDQTFRPVRIG
jgi:hypothetical protein